MMLSAKTHCDSVERVRRSSVQVTFLVGGCVVGLEVGTAVGIDDTDGVMDAFKVG